LTISRRGEAYSHATSLLSHGPIMFPARRNVDDSTAESVSSRGPAPSHWSAMTTVSAVEHRLSYHGRADALSRLLSVVSIAFLFICFPPAHNCYAADVKPDFVLNFSGYTGGPLDDWLRARHFTFEKDAKNRRLLQISIVNDALRVEAKGPASGFLLNDAVNLNKVARVRVTWGIIQYPAEVSYQSKVNNEALMLYFFFGSEKISSGHFLIPNSPYFIGLFLCQDEQIDFPYKGRYFHAGGRFVCLGKPKPNETIVSEFDLDAAFKKYFDKNRTPGVTGIGFGVDTSQSGRGGTAGAFIKSIEFIGADGSGALSN